MCVVLLQISPSAHCHCPGAGQKRLRHRLEGQQSGQTQTRAKQLHCMVEGAGTNHTHYDTLITPPTCCDISLRSPVPRSRALFLRHRQYTEAHDSLIKEMPTKGLPIGERLTKLTRVTREAARRARNAKMSETRTTKDQETLFNLLNWMARAVPLTTSHVPGSLCRRARLPQI